MFKRLHHVAYRCLDAEQTRAFYADLLGLKFAAALVQDYVPSLAQAEPHNHIFFEMADGSFIAFFDILHDHGPAGPPSPDWAQHLALEMESHEAAEALSARLRAAGVEVIGPVSHGMCDSWYFYDPNGHRLEMAVRTDSTEMWRGFADLAPVQMDKWSALKERVRP
ncbi:MAG: VOC family protein [Sphingobium sp.]|jgi:glyoxylase I family protein|nr:VOC family protein [Sphingobium sp.]MCI1270732.1 VOC family protein [Sphingobium sp.]MCI1755138.1 VOC family protein [Sphingobium sp.]MCI2053450.1 VOC family protein [Sphingobium sp.]